MKRKLLLLKGGWGMGIEADLRDCLAQSKKHCLSNLNKVDIQMVKNSPVGCGLLFKRHLYSRLVVWILNSHMTWWTFQNQDLIVQ